MAEPLHPRSSDAGHHHTDVVALRCGVVTVSDTRGAANDRSGAMLVDGLVAAGHQVAWRAIVQDDVEAIRGAVTNGIGSASLDLLLVTGGTGITARDVTPEAIEPLLRCTLPGFGEQFRALSYVEVGARGLLSRAFAGVIGTTLVFALPGSPGACRMALERLVLPLASHGAGLAHT